MILIFQNFSKNNFTKNILPKYKKAVKTKKFAKEVRFFGFIIVTLTKKNFFEQIYPFFSWTGFMLLIFEHVCIDFREFE